MKFLFIFLSLFVSTLLFSQAPEGINYQAVMRNSSGNLVTNSTVAIRVQIRQGSATGTTVYQERQSIVSSSQGLINMVIGAGTPQTGTFNAINWAVGPFFVNLAVDFSNGVNYQDFGTQQLMSVPYALYAKASGAQLNQWRYGNTVPVNSLGVLGDFYLDVVTGNVYYKNSTTTWVLTGNIKGPVGPSGQTGAQGAQGIQGATGAQGNQGNQGVTGTNGTNGQNTLVKSTTETAGANCTTGGIKIEYGLDANSNGTLDVSEINATLTRYVCNGATGAQGIQGLTGSQGIQGIAGTNGTNGSNGQNTLVKSTTEAAGANCTTGGVKIEYGLDANNNGTLDISEINATLTKYVCNGAVGATGAQGAQGIQGVAGTNGAQGIQGIAGAAGTNGTDGKNTLAKTTTEAAGANCTTGGVKIEYGLDANNNGTLDVSEINATLTKYVCNGAVGATGAQGIQGLTGAQGIQGVAGSTGAAGAAGKNTLVKTTTEAAGANCTTGGVKIEYGLDANSNGTLDVSEINASLTKYVCNGAVGATGAQGIQGLTGAQGIQGVAGTTGAAGAAGKNTLAKTTTEASGANCTTGGVKIEYGLDANNNGTLDVSEINATLTRYVCNGATGAQGIQGLTGAQGIQGVAGTNGTDGKNTLAKTTTETAGANCTTGGVKIEYGLDANNNGTLDISEVNASLTKYVCNGAVGATGAQGPIGLTGPTGATGAQGIQGVAGPTGASGSQGPIGLTGPPGATGAQGIQGATGAAGTNGVDGKNTLAKTTTEAAGANCTTGGVKIEYGLDANNNGTLDVSEINATLTRYVCNGATGAQGIQGVAGTNGTNGTDGTNALAKTTTEAAGANCTTGGVKIEYGLDANNNGTLDVSEINATLTRYVCNGATGAQGIQGVAGVPGTNGTNGAQGIQGVAGTNGTNGTDGKNTLAKTTTEAAGANCTTGGVKIEYGLDANSNGTLDVSEINATLTRYVCNGATGAQGIQGLTGAQGIQGVAGTNGTNGLNALIKTTTEPAGANCTNGGTKMETGLDANGNGVLDVSEIDASLTQFICGSSGIGGGFIPSQGVKLGFSTTTTWTCPIGVNQVQVELWGAGGGGGGRSYYWCSNSGGGSCGLPCNCVNGGNKGGDGGNGGYNKQVINVIPGNVYTITIGIGGSPGSNGSKSGQKTNCTPASDGSTGHATAGGNGQNSNFANVIIAQGGNGGEGGLFGANFCSPCSSSLCSVPTAQNGTNGAILNFTYPQSPIIGSRTYVPVGYVTGVPSNSSPGGKGATNYNDSSYPNAIAGENGYCIISY
jgi:hypothetical protein